MACVRTEAKSYCLLQELQFLETMKGDVVTNDRLPFAESMRRYLLDKFREYPH